MGHTPKLAHDPNFPQLQVITDALAMKDRLQREFANFDGGALHIHDLRLLQMRYKPGKKCEVCYEVYCSDLKSGKSGQQIFSGVMAPQSKLADRFARAQNQPQLPPQFGPAVHLLPDLGLLLWAFPNDSHLPQLPRLLASASRLALLRAREAEINLDHAATLIADQVELVKYSPFDRCTLRHHLRFSDGSTAVLYSKTFNHKTAASGLLATMQALWQSPLCQSGAFIVPRPLFCEAELNTLFMSALQGTNLDDHLEGLDLDHIAARLGAGLAGLHQCRLDHLPQQSPKQALAELAKAEQLIVSYDVTHQPLLTSLMHTLRAQHDYLPAMPATPIHNGFRISQCLLVDDRLAVIDFDDFQRGHPLVDVASFVAHLLYLPLRDKLTTAQSETAIRHFCRSYAQAAPWGLPPSAFAWHTAAQLVTKQATKCITLGKKDHARKVSHLLQLANAILKQEKQWC